ncbi:ABC transporter permease [Aliivibrio fischeri]|uniref:ABC transporter permease n=1 Tax=Aliivibrio fischeri TaxID=668 RepID=UPI00084CCAA9|nr:FtsX-like permease family protein [Aliivibrio fischeri]OED52401.1 ABC transporter substrate-binding protein [Aliivibrio fischeri]
MLIKLAWRNLWRQKRRTILTASALALALLLSLLMRSIQEGSYTANIENAARLSTGLIQLQNPEFKETQSIDDLLPMSDDFIAPTKQQPNIQFTLPRIETFSLAAAKDKSKGVLVVGVDPQPENTYSSLADKVVQGSYFTATDKSLLLSEGLARYFQLNVGDDIVLYGQGYRGQTAAGLYVIKGIVHFPMPDLNNQLIYLPIQEAVQLFSTENQVTSWVLHTRDFSLLPQTVEQLQKGYGQAVSVRPWNDLSPEMEQQIQIDRVSGIIMMYILYGIVGFGLFATLLMMTLERQREFGVMLATGMVRFRLLKLLVIESFFIGLLGILLGLVIAIPVLGYLYINPITLTGDTAKAMLEMGYDPVIPVLISGWLFINQMLIVTGLLLLCLIYPLWRVYHLDIVTALKGGSHAT